MNEQLKQIDPIDIILVTFRRLNFLQPTVKKIYERTRYPYRLLVVNNDSQDFQTIKWLTQKKGQGFVHDFINLDNNPGLAAGYTAGFKYLGDKCSKYFLTSQDDIWPPLLRHQCWMERLLELFKKYESEYAAIACRIQRIRRRDVDESKELIDSPTSLASIFRIQKMDEIKAVNGFGHRMRWESVSFKDRMQPHKKKFAVATHIYCSDEGFMPENKGFAKDFINYKSYSPERINQGELQPYPDIDPETNVPLKINTLRDRSEHKKRLEFWKLMGFKKSSIALDLLRMRSDKDNPKRGIQMGPFVHFLYTLARDYPDVSTIVEIGLGWGVSTNAWLYGFQDRKRLPKENKLYSIDINDRREIADVDLDNQDNWEFIQADSTKMKWDKGLIDILLIDGDHNYESVKADYENFEPHVRKDGLILLHDVSWPKKGVQKFYQEDLKSSGVILPLSPSGMAIIQK